MKKYCPDCKSILTEIGFTGFGSTIYFCKTCRKKWEIKEYKNE